MQPERRAHGLPLPPLEGVSGCLPLSAVGAVELAAALLAESADLVVDRLRSLVAEEPGLSMWVAHRAHSQSKGRVAAPADAAHWLASHALDELAQWNPARRLELGDFTAIAAVSTRLTQRCSAELPPDGRSGAETASGGFAPDSPRWSQPVDVSWVPALVRRLARLARLEHAFESELQAEKLAALKELAYGAGHEINNPLANISARAQTLLQDETDPQRRQRLAAINAQAFRAHEMIADLMLFARPPQMRPIDVDLCRCVREVVSGFNDQAAAQNTDLVYIPSAAPLTLAADPAQISVAVHALVKNALEAVSSGGRVTVSVGWRAPDGAGAAGGVDDLPVWAQIVVADDGPGIRPEIRHRLFDPFFSGREAGRGLGFGLSKCWRIVDAHGGQMEVSLRDPQGAVFTVQLPASAATTNRLCPDNSHSP